MATIATVLSEYNQALLRILHNTKSKTLTELAALSGSQVPNLSCTQRKLESYGLVALKGYIRQVEPIALAITFLVPLG